MNMLLVYQCENTLGIFQWYLAYLIKLKPKLRPPKPKYMLEGDVKNVLDIVKEEFAENDQLSNKELTLKSHHSFSFNIIYNISFKYFGFTSMIKASEYYQFQFYKLH